MQTYAVVDSEFRFVKIGRTTDIEARLSTLNTASPLPLILMATLDEDIEQDMHRMLAEHHQRLEWFRYNEETEGVIIARMSPTNEWFKARQGERQRRKKLGGDNQMGPVPVDRLTSAQRDRLSGVVMDSDRRFRYDPFGIPSDEDLLSVIARRDKAELLHTRRILSACAVRARNEIRNMSGSQDRARLAAVTFALSVAKNWRRRIGMELSSFFVRPSPQP